MTIYYIDFESRSPVPIKDGIDRYFTQAEATLCTMARENGPVKCWDILQEPEPTWFTHALTDPQAQFIAHNSPFDEGVSTRLLKVKTRTNQWWCTRAQAYAHGLPGGLEGLCAVLGVPQEHAKLKDGKRLIQLFCVPKKDGVYVEPWEAPGEWESFKEYAMRDIDALRSVHRRLPTHNFTGVNLEYFWLDADINKRGFAIDLPLIEAADALLLRAKSIGNKDVEELTGGAVTAITQRDKLLKWLHSKGVQLPNLTRAELERAIQDDSISPEYRVILAARLEGSRASGAKYKTALRQHVGGRLRYTQQFSGAGRTGRTAHKGFQPGNMPRPVTFNRLAPTLAEQHVPVKADFIDNVLLPALRDGTLLDFPEIYGGPNTACANALRHTLIAEPGNEFLCADLKNIESRALAWLAGEEWKCEAYRAADADPKNKSLDQYRLLYSRFFGADITTINDHQRNSAKVIELACSFGGSVGAFASMAIVYGMDLSLLPALVMPNADARTVAKADKAWWRAFLAGDDYGLEPDVYIACHILVQAYRSANPSIDAFKRDMGRAAEHVIRVRGSYREVGRCKLWSTADLMIMELPSGYRLCYWHPEIQVEEVTNPETGEKEERVYISFLRARGAKMIRERIWAGLVVENAAQACANQVLRYGKIEINRRWRGVLVLAVHDEALAEVPRGSISLEDFISALCKGWQWTTGFPLAASGWVGPRYGKRD